MKKPEIIVPLINLAFASLASGIFFADRLSISDGVSKPADESPKDKPNRIATSFNANAKAANLELNRHRKLMTRAWR